MSTLKTILISMVNKKINKVKESFTSGKYGHVHIDCTK